VHGSAFKDVERSRAEKDEVFDGVKTLRTLSEWSGLFARKGFRLAINDEKILSKIWKLENEEGDAKLWYPNRQVLKYAFYTKVSKSYTRDLRIDVNKAGTNKFVPADSV
jgi:hypothetical protein